MTSLRLRASLALVTAVACALSGDGAMARGGQSQAQTAQGAAEKQLQAKLAQASTESEIPSLRNAGAPLVRVAFDLAGIRALPLDIDAYGAVCGPIGDVLTGYTDAAKRIAAHAANPDAANAALLLRLQNEVTLGSEGAIQCMDKGFRTVAPMVATLPADRRGPVQPGLKQMRDGSVQVIMGSIDSALDPGLSAANRAKLYSDLRTAAVMVAASFPAAERESLRVQIRTRQATAPAGDRQQLAALAQIFAGSECNVLCAAAEAK